MKSAIRNGELKRTNGLVDFLASGIYGEEKIPCQIGYIEDTDTFGDKIALPAYIFIDDGVTEDGNHYYKATINLCDNASVDVDEEKI